jgi:hypothetical protein
LSCHRHRFLLLIFCCLLGSTAQAALIPADVKKASPLTATDTATVTKVVNEQLAKMTGQDVEAGKLARQALIEEVDLSGGAASADYQKQYIKAVVNALKPLMAKGKQEQRNAAVIIGGLAQRVEKSNLADILAPQVKQMLASNDGFVNYWALKASKYVLAATVANTGKDGGLSKLIVDQVKKGDNAGVMTEEAYNALALDPLKGNNGQVKEAGVTAAMLMDLLEWRISLYKAGSPPPNPPAERTATTFLSFNGWDALSANPVDRDRAMKDVGDLACSQLNALNLGYEPDLADAALSTGFSIGALALHFNNDADLSGAAAVFKSIGPNMDTSKITGGCETIKKAFEKHNIHISAP